ncbi:MAG: hypothetical protein ACJ71Z_12130 [Aeromicrobium sp.]
MISALVLVEAHGGGFFAEYWSILTDPAHVAVEVTLTLLLDGLLLGMLWPLVRQFLDAKLHKQHEQFDQEHGIHHHGDHVHIDPEILHPQDEHPNHD